MDVTYNKDRLCMLAIGISRFKIKYVLYVRNPTSHTKYIHAVLTSISRILKLEQQRDEPGLCTRMTHEFVKHSIFFKNIFQAEIFLYIFFPIHIKKSLGKCTILYFPAILYREIRIILIFLTFSGFWLLFSKTILSSLQEFVLFGFSFFSFICSEFTFRQLYKLGFILFCVGSLITKLFGNSLLVGDQEACKDIIPLDFASIFTALRMFFTFRFQLGFT